MYKRINQYLMEKDTQKEGSTDKNTILWAKAGGQEMMTYLF